MDAALNLRRRYAVKTAGVFLLAVMFAYLLSGCARDSALGDAPTHETAVQTSTTAPSSTPAPTLTLPSTSPTTPPPTDTPLPTDIPPTQEPTEVPTDQPLNLTVTCPTPKSLMLHSAFGAARMEQLADVIDEEGWRTVTYRDLIPYLQKGECPPQDIILVSVDDLGTDWLRPDFKEMVQVFLDWEMVLTLGVVVKDPQSPEIWKYFRKLHRAGMEIASHSVNHYNLPDLVDPRILEEEVSGSYLRICENLYRCPVSIALPFGNGGEDPRVVEAIIEAGYTFMIGIGNGRQFSGEGPYLLGRIPPDNDDQTITIRYLENTFDPCVLVGDCEK